MTSRTLSVQPVSEAELRTWGETIRKPEVSLVTRAQAMWGLRHAKEPLAAQLLADYIVQVVPPSPGANALLQHEAAYCLGQKGDVASVDALECVIRNPCHEAIVRHEAGEALAAIAGRPGADVARIRTILSDFVGSPIVELSETCEIGLGRLDWLALGQPVDSAAALAESRFPNTVDPAPAFPTVSAFSADIAELRSILLNPKEKLFSRYQALFSLRNASLIPNDSEGSQRMKEIIEALSAALEAPGSALLRHEVAFILGQLSLTKTGNFLLACLESGSAEHPMVRHEAAMALGEVVGAAEDEAQDESGLNLDFVQRARAALQAGLNDPEPVVRDSCALALDMADYVVSTDRFQYATVPAASVALSTC
uniref:Deoxyhypusine monooxygenase n=1 Tax=Schistocephalus solidus TaxID=70667 RepID=A0A0X3PL55_SCHSO